MDVIGRNYSKAEGFPVPRYRQSGTGAFNGTDRRLLLRRCIAGIREAKPRVPS